MRIVPVIIESMTINEVQYDSLLNAEEASVTMGLAVVTPCYCCNDQIAQGALQYTQLMQDTLATVNLANTVAEVVDLIPF
jgi:microsomal dipeptidase-like Zn-dependent dipeptidase